jgi:hypothetical protein
VSIVAQRTLFRFGKISRKGKAISDFPEGTVISEPMETAYFMAGSALSAVPLKLARNVSEQIITNLSNRSKMFSASIGYERKIGAKKCHL